MSYITSIYIAASMLAVGVMSLLVIVFPQEHIGWKVAVSAGISGGIASIALAICQAIKGE